MNPKKPHHQRGAMAVMTALLLPMLLGFMALALDVGYVLLQRNRMQVAADAAALLAAGARQHGQDINSAQALALTATQANGFTQGVDQTLVSVAIPPGGTGSFANDTQYVRVTVTQPVHAWLAWIFGITRTTTAASAVGGPAGSSQPCLLSLASAASGALIIQGNSVVTANSCGIFVNSSSNTAMQVSGNVTVTANPIQVVGNYTAIGNVTISPVSTGAAASANPFTSLAVPLFTGCTFTNYTRTGNGSLVLAPGTYCGGISITGNHAVQFSAGTYVLYGGGMQFSGNIAPIAGSGVTFFNSGNGSSYPYSALNVAGNISLNLSAPSSGPYAGLLFMQDPLNTLAANIVGNSGAVLAGNLYFPQSNLTLTGNSGTAIPTGSVVAQKVSVVGNTQFTMTNAYGSGSNSSAHAGLYE
jgi:hypothetical protein